MTQSPQEQLATDIVAALVESNLLDKAKQQETSRKIVTGQLKQEDWSLLIELANTPKQGSDSDE